MEFQNTDRRHQIALFVVFASLAVLGCSKGGSPRTANGELRDVPAVVQRFPIDSDTFVLVPVDSTDTRYVPDELPVEFRQDGLHVVFSGKLAPIPPNVRLVGIPIELQSVRRMDGRRAS